MSLLESVRLGSQTPTLLHLPRNVGSSAGADIVDFVAESTGLEADPWQCDYLDTSCAEQLDGRWAAFENAAVLPRQNGKNTIFEERQLGGLFLLEDRLQIHSAHEFKTCYEHFLRMKDLIEGSPALMRMMPSHGIRTGTADMSITTKKGCRLRFVARSRSSGRGLSGDVVYLDEAWALTAPMMGALLFTMSARPNPQLFYASSAPMYSSEFLHGLLKRAGREDEPRLFLAAWENLSTAAFNDVDAWYRANPAMGRRITEEFVSNELRILSQTPEGVAEFARERLGIREGGDGEAGVVPYDVWSELKDENSRVGQTRCFGLMVSPDAAWASFSVAGRRRDGSVHVETVRREMGTGWIVPFAVELFGRHQVPLRLLPSSAAGALLKALAAARVPVVEVVSREYAQACVDVLEAVKNRGVRHLGQESMNRSVAAAGKSAEDKGLWVWARPGAVDITPLEAATLAWTGAIGPVFKPKIHVLTKEAAP